MTIDVGVLDGAGGQNLPDAIPMRLAGMLDPAKYRIVPLPYKAAIGPANPTPNPLDVGSGMESSIVDGVEVGTGFAQESPNVVAFIGFSLGSSVAYRLAEQMHAGRIRNTDGTPIERAWWAFIAGPYCHPDETGNYGIAGEHGPIGPEPHLEIANPPDAVCRTPPSSPLRSFVPLGNLLTFTLDEATIRSWRGLWTEQIEIQAKRLAAVGLSNPQWWLQPWNIDRARREIEATIAVYRHAIVALDGYLKGTTHVTDYVTKGLLARAAAELNGLS